MFPITRCDNCQKGELKSNGYVRLNCPRYSRKRTSKTVLLLFSSLAFILLVQKASSADANKYPSKAAKSVMTRPAMRLSRLRPSGRRRIFHSRRPPIRLPVQPGYRRVITRKQDIVRQWPKPYPVRITTSAPNNVTSSSELTTTETTSTTTTTTTTTTERTASTKTPASTSTKDPEQTSTQAPAQTSTQAPVPTTSPAPAPTSTRAPSPTSTQAPSPIRTVATRPRTRPTVRPRTRPTARPISRPSASANFLRKSTRFRNMSLMHALRRMNKDGDYNDILKKLDYFMSYYPTVREAGARLSNLLTKHEQTSREERRRIWKSVIRAKSDLRTVNSRCSVMQRNVTEVMARVGRHAHEFDGYQKTAKKKIDQIEIHQGSQDKQYFEIYQLASNNSRELERMSGDIAVLLPLIGGLFENLEKNNMQEKLALESLDQHARGNIADMTNQILIQQNTLANLGNQVRTEMDELHGEKQSMASSMEQHQRRLSDTVNSHLSEHVRQLNRIEGSINMHTEKIKYITSIVEKHDDMLDRSLSKELEFSDQITSAREGLKKVEANISRFMNNYRRTESGMVGTTKAVGRLENYTRLLITSLNGQHEVLTDTVERMNRTDQEVRSVSHKLDSYMVKQDVETERIGDDLDEILEVQRIHRNNITNLFFTNIRRKSSNMVSQYPSDEPSPESTSVTPQELRSLLTEIGVEDRMTRLTRVLRHQQQRMSNVTRAVLRIAEDNEAITMTTSHYFRLINTQAKLIKNQNETIGKLAMIATNQGDTIKSLSMELNNGQDTLMKLTNILANIASQFKSPMGSQRDCHDVWLNGNRKSGVYSVIKDLSLRPIYCNLTEYGGWTIIQRRIDGSQDFDRTMKEYTNGFGDVYGEYWIGLDTIKTLTQTVRPSVGLQIIIEDWEGNFRTAAYSQFYVYGESFNLVVSGYLGDAGDSLSQSSGKPFSAKESDQTGSCAHRRRAGWWFSSPLADCGKSSLNGVYRKGPAQDAEISSTIYWKNWLGVGYPLKSVTMQTISTDIINKVYEERESQTGAESDQINDPKVEDSNKKTNSNSNFEDSYDPYKDTQEKPPSYEEDLRQVEWQNQNGAPEYGNFDYNILLNDG